MFALQAHSICLVGVDLRVSKFSCYLPPRRPPRGLLLLLGAGGSRSLSSPDLVLLVGVWSGSLASWLTAAGGSCAWSCSSSSPSGCSFPGADCSSSSVVGGESLLSDEAESGIGDSLPLSLCTALAISLSCFGLPSDVCPSIIQKGM